MSAPMLVIRRDSRAMRAYAWLWGADPRRTNFCKLFWAVVFAPVALLIFKPLDFILRRKMAAKKLARIEGFGARHPQVARVTGLVWMVYMLLAVGWCLFWVIRWFIREPAPAAIVTGGALLVSLVLVWLLRAHLDALAKFGTFLLIGYRAVKTRTCPRIELRDKDAA